MNQCSLSQAELAILLAYLAEDRPLLDQPDADLGLVAAQVHAVEARLHTRGLLVRSYEDTLSVLGEVRSLLEAMLNPATLAILSLTHPEQHQLPLCFSFTPAGCVLTFMDAQGRHQLAALPSLDAAVDTIMRRAGPPGPPIAATTPRVWSDLMADSRLSGLLLVIEAPAQAATTPQMLRWVEAANQVWLADAAAPLGHPVTISQLREQVAATLHSAVARPLV